MIYWHPMNRKILSLAVLVSALSMAGMVAAQPVAQGPTSTPQPVNLATAAPSDAPVAGATPTRTPTPEGQIFIEARDFANVRAQPDPDAAQLGQIRAGERYVALGRYFQWIQFQYDPSPSGRGWVFGDLVNVIGEVTLIPEVTDPVASSPDSAEIQAASTAAAVTLTPGGILTSTASARFEQLGQLTQQGPVILPTFTYPPGIVFQPTAATALPDSTPEPAIVSSSVAGSVPPVVPVLILGGLGVLGLLANRLRRRS